ncbi:putative glycolipid-binding domain-containing protein [Streptomyces sp. GC420]|uniref:putative glycolipid-binding domain-containing protein n=1 Tax=Streptomyces sp. GC420 TaxID=2697568 RepID=UPI0014152342|nr:putative glycolipid-binding domain-containing protein [Streptomyces sp. GC420]NBM21109.1 hypothetical protein [Streptomyces sp. GC420]
MSDVKAPTWQVTASGGFESAWVTFKGGTLHARGRAFGALPEPCWISYELETGEEWTTRRLTVTSETATDTHSLELRRAADTGVWTANGTTLTWAAESLDCDLGLSPLTNTMPVLRRNLHREPGEHTFLMAWVSVPGLQVRPSRQTYAHLAPGTVRFTSGDFTANLEFDRDGLIVAYPDLAYRLAGRASA